MLQERKTGQSLGGWAHTMQTLIQPKVALLNEPGAYDTLSSWKESLKW